MVDGRYSDINNALDFDWHMRSMWLSTGGVAYAELLMQTVDATIDISITMCGYGVFDAIIEEIFIWKGFMRVLNMVGG